MVCVDVPAAVWLGKVMATWPKNPVLVVVEGTQRPAVSKVISYFTSTCTSLFTVMGEACKVVATWANPKAAPARMALSKVTPPPNKVPKFQAFTPMFNVLCVED